MKPGRNEPCPCGSGDKYKKCCGKADDLNSASSDSMSAPPSINELTGWMNSGRYAQVEMHTRTLLERQPNSGALWKLHGGALMLQGKDSLRALRRAADLLPQDAQIQFSLGHVLQDRGDFTDAIAKQRKAITLKADFAEAHDSLGMLLQSTGQPADAAESYRRALALRPDFAEAHGNLGNALVDLRQFDEAIVEYRRMIELRPDVPEAHNNLGNAYLPLGLFEEAASSYARALRLCPDSAGAHANLSNALRELGQSRESLRHGRRALELQPNFPDAHRFVGNALFDMGRLDEAAAAYGHALELEPDHVDAHIALGKVLRQIGRIEDAEAACRRALVSAPDCAEALTLLGELQGDLGRFAEAQSLFERALAIAPDMPEAWACQARHRKMGAGDEAWLAAAQSLLDKPMGRGQKINLRYALGKYFDDVQDFDVAFEFYRLANELQKDGGIRPDPERFARQVNDIVRLHNRDGLSGIPANGNLSKRPIFIVGMPRSGTSLAEQILASHPSAFGAGELRFWHAAAADYQSAAPDEGARRHRISAAAEHYLSLLTALSPDAGRVVDKMPANFLNLGLIHAALPNARIIHMQRDPLDTCLSIYFQTFSNTHSYATDLTAIADYFRQYSRLMRHWQSTLPEHSVLHLSYEKLVQDPEPWIRTMLEFVDLPWDSRCLDFHKTDRAVTTASNWQVRQKMNASSIGRWRNYEKFLGPLRGLSGPGNAP